MTTYRTRVFQSYRIARTQGVADAIAFKNYTLPSKASDNPKTLIHGSSPKRQSTENGNSPKPQKYEDTLRNDNIQGGSPKRKAAPYVLAGSQRLKGGRENDCLEQLPNSPNINCINNCNRNLLRRLRRTCWRDHKGTKGGRKRDCLQPITATATAT